MEIMRLFFFMTAYILQIFDDHDYLKKNVRLIYFLVISIEAGHNAHTE